jgi:DNA polymerase III epsilon subunit-like protein
MEKALNIFIKKAKNSKVLVAHNLDFDINLIMSEIWRLHIFYRKKEHEKSKYIDMINVLLNTKIYCTMLNTIDLCKIPFKNSYDNKNNKKDNWKYPKLEELYEKLFNKKPTNCHNSLYDIRHTAKCFFKLRDMWYLDNNINK